MVREEKKKREERGAVVQQKKRKIIQKLTAPLRNSARGKNSLGRKGGEKVITGIRGGGNERRGRV